GDRPDQQLSLRPDVEQAGAKWNRDRDARRDQRREKNDRGRKLQRRVLAARAQETDPAQQSLVRVDGVRAADEDDETAGDEGEQDRAKRYRQAAEPRQHSEAGAGFLARPLRVGY